MAIFLILGFFDLSNGKIAAADNFTAVVFFIIFLLVDKKYKFTVFTAVFAGLIFVPNLIGHMGCYGWADINYHWDWIVHFTAALFSTLVVLSFLLHNSICKRFINAAFIAIFVTISFGALIEASEYWGFIAFGFGEGYLGFGEGDNSQHFGPWENSSLDTTINFVGSFLAAFIYGLFVLSKNKIYYSKR